MIQTQKWVFLGAILVWTLSACKTELPCIQCDAYDQGIIEPIAAGPNADCTDAAYPVDAQWVIKSVDEYQQVSNRLQFSPTGCDSLTLASIDFDQYSVLSMAAEASGCTQQFCPRVETLAAEEKYRFTIKVIECGGCEPLVIQRFWVVVPRLPDTYTVDFVVQR